MSLTLYSNFATECIQDENFYTFNNNQEIKVLDPNSSNITRRRKESDEKLAETYMICKIELTRFDPVPQCTCAHACYHWPSFINSQLFYTSSACLIDGILLNWFGILQHSSDSFETTRGALEVLVSQQWDDDLGWNIFATKQGSHWESW